MMEFLNEYLFNGTGWLILAMILIGLEFMAPGIYFMWVGFGAVVVSLVTYVLPDLAPQWQVLIFAVMGVVSVLIGRKYLMEKESPSDDSTLNRRGSQYVGKVCEVAVDFKNGKGKVKVEDTLWSAMGPKDYKAGASVKIVSQDGTRFNVEAAK